MKPLPPPPAIIFDFDGVIADSLTWHLAAWKAATQEIFHWDMDEKTYLSLVGHSTRHIAQLLATMRQQPESADVLAKRKTELLMRKKESVPLLPGVKNLITYLDAKKIPYGIASNAPRDFVRDILDVHKLHVKVVLGREDAPRPKPAPEPFLFCARQLGVSITDHPHIWVFEDSVHGLQAAVAAQMFPIGVTTQTSAVELTAAGAQRTCHSLAEVLDQNWLAV